jgi:peptidyl-prolyl cis-trans isomerase C
MNLLALALALFVAGAACAQDPAKKGAPAPKGPTPPAGAPKAADTPPAAPKSGGDTSGSNLYSQQTFDFLLKERVAAGQPDSPQLREMIKDELINRELVIREAKKKGMDKDPAIKTSMDLNAQSVLVRAYMQDYLKNNQPNDEQLKKDYEMIKSALGNKEYRARHILVEKEDEAKDIIAQLQKGEKFEKLAERSKDPGSKDKGGDLDWASPANFAKPFSDAMIALQKGKFTPTPVQTQFGWHVIMLEDVRDTKAPTFEEVKPNLTQRAQGIAVEKHLADLRQKAGVK